MKYSILMPYYKRAEQLKATLESFEHFYKNRKDYEIILVVDVKCYSMDNKNILVPLVHTFKNLNIKCIAGTVEESYSPSTNYNIGANFSNGEFIVLTNPENMHTVNILQGLDDEFEKSKDSYVVCSCLSVQEKYLPLENVGRVKGQWYQHSIHRNIGAHFCSAISRNNYFKIGGFSEEFSAGIGYDDDDFRNKVQKSGIPFVYRDDLMTLHLFHEQASKDMNLFYRNNKLYHDKWGANAFSAGQLPLV